MQAPPAIFAPRLRRGLDFAFVALWTLFIFSGLAFKVTERWRGWPPPGNFVLAENRLPNPFPDLRHAPAKEWGRGLEAWYNDHFAWRQELIGFYRFLHFHWLKTAVNELVPGLDNWIFRKQGNWSELDDYLGGFELTPQQALDWVDFFEGRAAWAEAHGVVYLQVVTSVKAQVMPEKIPAVLRRHRGVSVREQVQAALRGSFAEPHVLFTHETLVAAAQAREVFYQEDHHPNAYGTYLVFRAIAERLGAWLPDMEPMRFYDNPPAAVRAGAEPGCYEEDRRLKVVVPGLLAVKDPLVRRAPGGRFPLASIATEQPAPQRTLVMGNDSYMRFPLASWHKKPQPVPMPLAVNFSRLVSLIFQRFQTVELDYIVSQSPPAVLIEQFPEMRLLNQVEGLDATMRTAARFGRGTPRTVWTPAVGGPPPAPAAEPFTVLATLERVTAGPDENAAPRMGGTTRPLPVELLADGKVIATAQVNPGVRRAVFFAVPALPAPAELAVRVQNGQAVLQRLEIRTGGER